MIAITEEGRLISIAVVKLRIRVVAVDFLVSMATRRHFHQSGQPEAAQLASRSETEYPTLMDLEVMIYLSVF
jgi:hypothetical protein